MYTRTHAHISANITLDILSIPISTVAHRALCPVLRDSSRAQVTVDIFWYIE